jgi:hypothetical protein
MSPLEIVHMSGKRRRGRTVPIMNISFIPDYCTASVELQKLRILNDNFSPSFV